MNKKLKTLVIFFFLRIFIQPWDQIFSDIPQNELPIQIFDTIRPGVSVDVIKESPPQFIGMVVLSENKSGIDAPQIHTVSPVFKSIAARDSLKSVRYPYQIQREVYATAYQDWEHIRPILHYKFGLDHAATFTPNFTHPRWW